MEEADKVGSAFLIGGGIWAVASFLLGESVPFTVRWLSATYAVGGWVYLTLLRSRIRPVFWPPDTLEERVVAFVGGGLWLTASFGSGIVWIGFIKGKLVQPLDLLATFGVIFGMALLGVGLINRVLGLTMP